MADGFFAGIGDLIDRIKWPPDLLLIIGLGLFGSGVVKGPFAISNLMIGWGLIAMAAGMGFRMLSQRAHTVTIGPHEIRTVRKSYLVWGIALLGAACVLVYYEFMRKWPFFHQ